MGMTGATSAQFSLKGVSISRSVSSGASPFRDVKSPTAARFRHSISDADVPEHRLHSGDIVKLVDHHVASDGADGYSIEVFTALGDTIADTSVPASSLEALRQDDVLCARTLQLTTP
jgi:hypothetical protein